MAVTLKGQSAIYEGTSADMKPSDAAKNAIFQELDTGIDYYYNGTAWNEIPRSGGGGGTGTDNYNELNNKPSINGTVLSGNKSLDNLGIQAKLTFDDAPTSGSSNPVKSDGVYSALGGKQDAISDLQSIRNGAAAGATAVQPIVGKGLSTNDYTTEEKNKLAAIEAQANKTVVDSTLNSSSTNPVQNKVVKSALDNKQDSLTMVQLAAVNSGITSADVDQIETNKNNISFVQSQANWNTNNGVKNICPYNSGSTSGDGTVWNNLPIDIVAGTYSLSFSTDSTNSALVLLAADGVTEVLRKTYSTTTVNDTFTISVAAKYIRLYIGASKTVSNFMIRPDFAESTYQPYAKSNSDLTALSAEDRASLVELVDEGAKNKLSIGAPTTIPAGLTCVRNNDGTYTVSGTLAAANSISFSIDTIDGDLVLSGCPEGGGNDTYLLIITKSGSQVSGSVDTGTGSDVFTMDGAGYALGIRFAAGAYNDLIFKPMICTKADWDISQSYQPYRPSYDELIARVEALENA